MVENENMNGKFERKISKDFCELKIWDHGGAGQFKRTVFVFNNIA